MAERLSSVSPKGQITLPVEVRRQLGIKPKDRVSIALEGNLVIVRPVVSSLEAGFRSIPALDRRRSLEELTELAAEESAREAAREGL